ncbi:unnamed protein product [Durusdinium trenchii]|uniref:Uncharacterized protein n=1 Tax=Durusdinium trenchii TaxID=1381693 RepID=A0ABP0L7S8_9DINO
MAPTCFSGCARGLPEFLKGRGCLRGLRDNQSAALAASRQADLLVERDGAAASIPQLSCPGLISRSQSAISEEVQSGASFAMERPTLLTAKAVSPRKETSAPSPLGKLGPSPRDLDGPDGSLSALTTATAFEEVGSPGNAQTTFGCCIAGAPNPRSTNLDSEWFWDTSAAVGEAAWNGGKNVASFLGEQIYTAAVFAQPHLESMASSTANALKAAAEDSMDKIRALGPRRSKLERARASMALHAPVLQTPALPSLPELDAYTAQMGFGFVAPGQSYAQPPTWSNPGQTFAHEVFTGQHRLVTTSPQAPLATGFRPEGLHMPSDSWLPQHSHSFAYQQNQAALVPQQSYSLGHRYQDQHALMAQHSHSWHMHQEQAAQVAWLPPRAAGGHAQSFTLGDASYRTTSGRRPLAPNRISSATG